MRLATVGWGRYRSTSAGSEWKGLRIRRLGPSIVLAGSLLAATATAVAAHECTIASRSAQGDAGALHSSRWVRLTLQDVFGFIGGEVGGRNLTPDEIDQAVGMAIDAGPPAP